MNTKSTELSSFIFSSSEVELHYKRPLFHSMKSIARSEDAQEILRTFINPNRLDLKEFFWILLLSNANRLVAVAEISSGSPRCVQIQIREIFQLTLITNTSNFIVAHCHPSGNLKISESDKKLTSKLQELCELLELTLLDHIILTSESYTSFSDTGKL